MVPLKIVSNVSRFKPALNLNRVLADFGGFKPRHKFLNSISGRIKNFERNLYLFKIKVGFERVQKLEKIGTDSKIKNKLGWNQKLKSNCRTD